MIVNDLWGIIKVEKKYECIINSKEFKALKNKTQLGLNVNYNAVHNRYQHSLGTYYLACKLVEICKEKFADILNISNEDEEAIKCCALLHDIGHGCFSHVSEKFLTGTHEERTVALLLNEETQIHQAIITNFGESVLHKIIDLINLKENIKENKNIDCKNDMLLIVSKLLSGGIDIDRLDYIYRDSKYVYNENNNFSDILDYIDLEYIDDGLEIVFSDKAEFIIANFFNKRFELYDKLYFEKQTVILEEIFAKFIQVSQLQLTWDTTETQLNDIFRTYAAANDIILNRYATLLENRVLDEDVQIKEVSDKEVFDNLKNRLLKRVPILKEFNQCFFETSSQINIYNKKNKILINKDGLIQDISDYFEILNSYLKKEKFVLAVDINLLISLMNKKGFSPQDIASTVQEIKKCLSLDLEQEKKYGFSKEYYINPSDGFSIVKETLGLKDAKYITNVDVYYDHNDILESRNINVRKRICSDGKQEWTVKRPLSDKTSISKREEKNFYSIEEVLNFLQSEWKIPINKLEELITLETNREKYIIEYQDSIIEVVFDATKSKYNNQEYDTNYMIECELKSGNTVSLYFLNEQMKQFKFLEEINQSKKKIALGNVKNVLTKPIEHKQDYNDQLLTYFSSSLELLDKLKALDVKKQEILRLKDKYGDLKTPLVVTFSGTPRAGKTTCKDNLFEFLKKTDLKTTCLDEPAGIIYAGLKTKDEKLKLLEDRVGFVEQQYDIGQKYINQNLANNEILLCDRGVIDTFIWYDMYYKMGMMDEDRYNNYLNRLKDISEYDNYFFSLFVESLESMRRDYTSSLSIEPRTTTTPEFVEQFNSAMLRVFPSIEKHVNYAKLINTTNYDKMEPSFIIANDLLDSIKRKYTKE